MKFLWKICEYSMTREHPQSSSLYFFRPSQKKAQVNLYMPPEVHFESQNSTRLAPDRGLQGRFRGTIQPLSI